MPKGSKGKRRLSRQLAESCGDGDGERESGKRKQYSPEQPEKEDQSILGAHKKIPPIFGSNMNQQNHAKQTRNKDGYLKAIQISGGAKLRSIAIRRGPRKN